MPTSWPQATADSSPVLVTFNLVLSPVALGAATPVPTSGTIALLLMVAALGGMGLVLRRSNQRH